MKKITIDTNSITDWLSFHDVSKQVFDFPQSYRENMIEWVEGISVANKEDLLVVELNNAKSFKERCPEQYKALVDGIAFANYRSLMMEGRPIAAISFFDFK
ncbi:MAG: barstar family protein [Parcubacteria group bacterium]